MRKQWFLLLFVFLVNYCSAQPPATFTYYTVASNRWVAEVTLTKDSLFKRQTKAAGVKDDERYAIVGKETKGAYTFVYTKKTPPVLKAPAGMNLPIRTWGIEHIALFVFSVSADKEKMQLLQEFDHASIEAAKSADANNEIADKYFTTWYSKSALAKFTQYPDLVDADKATVQKVLDDLMSNLSQNKVKIKNTRYWSMQYNLSGVLIGNHLSPMASIADLDKKTTEYNIKIPAIR